jgi:hypothetical protein
MFFPGSNITFYVSYPFVTYLTLPCILHVLRISGFHGDSVDVVGLYTMWMWGALQIFGGTRCLRLQSQSE